jgi:monoamine oxidase
VRVDERNLSRRVTDATRRAFLKQGSAALAVATTAAVPSISAASEQLGRRAERADVVIVGGGASGMYAAMLLRDAGLQPVVLEAGQRAGGRILTGDALAGKPEFGMSQIGPMYARTRDVAQRLGVRLGAGANVNAPYAFIVQDRMYSRKEWASVPANRTVGAEREIPPNALSGFYVERRSPFTSLDDWLKPEAAQYDVSLLDWLNRQNASPEAIRLIDEGLVDPGVAGASLLRLLQEATRSKIDIEALANRSDMQGKDVYERFALTSSHVVGGSSRYAEAMAADLGDSLRLRHSVRRIRDNGRYVEVSCANGRRFRARFAIVTLPFSVLRDVEFHPALSGTIAEAVQRMPYGRQSQVWMTIKGEPYWEIDGYDASMWSDGPLTLIRQQIESDGSRIQLGALAIGRKGSALDRIPAKDRGAFVLDYLARVRPSTRGRLEVTGVFSWEESPTARGCSFQLTPGRASDWRAELVRPRGLVHFAGEHTRRLEVGLEAAMESGERSALEVLERASA